MTRVPIGAVLLLILLLIAWPWVTEPPPAPALAGLALQGDGDNPVVRVEVVYASGEVVAFYPAGSPVATATPDATDTPVPSHTPPPTDTPTPTATVTPMPTHTPAATVTPLPFPTPTPEATLAPATPGPTQPPPPETHCTGAALYTTRKRTGPGVDYPQVVNPDGSYGWMMATERDIVVELLVRYPEGDPLWEVWGLFGDNTWRAIAYRGTELIRLDDSPACWELPITYDTAPLPRAAVLIHTVPGANAWELLLAGAVFQRAGIRWGAKVVSDPDLCRQVVERGGECQFRSVHPADCPNVLNPDPEQEAYLWLLAIAPYTVAQGLPDHNVWLEVVNECNMDDLAWWNAFMVEFVRLASARGWPPLILPTWHPGAPDVEDLPALREGLVALRDAGGLLGMHAYSIDPAVGLCQSDDWLGYRHRRIRAQLDAMGLDGLAIAITEAARGAGDQAPNTGDFSCWVCAVIEDEGLHSVALWTAGTAWPWWLANLNGRMVDLAGVIGARCG